MPNRYVQTNSLSVGYNGRALIHDIDLDIEKGAIVALIGPNGAGKSTILKTITRQLAQIAGTVEIDGTDLNKMSYRDLASRMAVVLTERMKPELMTCWDIVATGRYPYTGRLGILSAEDEEKVRGAMEIVHAMDLCDRDFNAISDGQRQRILLARAICQEPEIIVLDEPTSFLDIRHKLELLSILRSMAKENGITVVMSLHEIDLAEKIADWIICVKGETIFRFGRPEEIFQEDTIRELYEIENGFFDPCFGSIELPRPAGEPDVFVLSGAGCAIPVYRALQKQDCPFAAGILFENDVDYRLARLLAADVISVPPFGRIGDDAFERAMTYVRTCSRVIDSGVPIGEANMRMQELRNAARDLGKLEDWKS